jgi:hypothetical protein
MAHTEVHRARLARIEAEDQLTCGVELAVGEAVAGNEPLEMLEASGKHRPEPLCLFVARRIVRLCSPDLQGVLSSATRRMERAGAVLAPGGRSHETAEAQS